MIHRLSGVMVDAGDWDESALSSGALTDCSALAEAIASDNDGELVLEINSFGGSVDGGRLIQMALRDWCLRNLAGKMTIRVGALAASAAANLLACAPEMAEIDVYPETDIMFHSCSGMVSGSPGQLKDAADHMCQVNERVIRALMRRTDLEEQKVCSWFDDGREGWLTGEEAVSCGLAGSLISGSVSQPVEPDGVNYPMEARLAARFSKLRSLHQEDTTMEEENKNIETEETEAGMPQDAVLEPVEEENKPEDTEVAEEENNPEEAPCEGKCKSERPCEDDELKKENESLKQELAALKQELESLKSTHAMLTRGLGAVTASVSSSVSWLDIVKGIPAGLSARDYSRRYEALKNEHASAFQAYMDSHQGR